MNDAKADAVGYVLCDDLIFTSRITGSAQALGLKLKPARSVEALQALVKAERPRSIIVDLANPGMKLTDLLAFLRAACSPMPRVIAYGSHVDTATLRAAREAGCHTVLPRSKFVEDLPRALPEWMAPVSERETA